MEKINRDTWSRFRDLFGAKAGILNCRIPLRIARNAVTQLTYSDCADVAAALAKYDIDNQKIHDLLMMALSNCQEGRNVLAAYVYNPDLADKANPAAHADDGRGTYLQLEKMRMAIRVLLPPPSICDNCLTSTSPSPSRTKSWLTPTPIAVYCSVMNLLVLSLHL